MSVYQSRMNYGAGPIRNRRQTAIATAQAAIMADAVFFDTETTGFVGNGGEAIELCVLDVNGNVLLDTLLKPVGAVSDGARAVHKITDEMLAGAPTLKTLELAALNLLANGRPAVGYNCKSFDVPIIGLSLKAHGLRPWHDEIQSVDAMLLFQDFIGRPRWTKLSEAAEICGLSVPLELHRARADSELTRLLMHHMAQQA